VKFLRRTVRYNLFGLQPPPPLKEKSEENLEELKVEPFDEKLTRYESNWLRHVTGMNSSRMSKVMLKCGPN